MLAKESVEDRLIRLGLIREMHHILLESVCGQDKEPDNSATSKIG